MFQYFVAVASDQIASYKEDSRLRLKIQESILVVHLGFLLCASLIERMEKCARPVEPKE